MSDGLKAAAERFTRNTYGSLDIGQMMRRHDSKLLAEAYLTVVSAREAEQLERSKPIDGDWLRGLCQSVSAGETFWFVDDYIFLVRWSGGFHLKCHDRSIAEQATRGDLLDLLSALKIPTKEGAK